MIKPQEETTGHITVRAPKFYEVAALQFLLKLPPLFVTVCGLAIVYQIGFFCNKIDHGHYSRNTIVVLTNALSFRAPLGKTALNSC